LINLPQLSVTTGGVGATALAAQATVKHPEQGNVTVGGAIVIGIAPSCKATAITIGIEYKYRFLYLLKQDQPIQAGAAGVITLPQLSITTGGVGATALATQATVDAPGPGSVTVGGAIV
jgi:hypothetical protein